MRISNLGKAEKGAKVKSAACSQVLQLMDKDYSYQDALKKVLAENPAIKKADLEKELDIYI